MIIVYGALHLHPTQMAISVPTAELGHLLLLPLVPDGATGLLFPLGLLYFPVHHLDNVIKLVEVQLLIFLGIRFLVENLQLPLASLSLYGLSLLKL